MFKRVINDIIIHQNQREDIQNALKDYTHMSGGAGIREAGEDNYRKTGGGRETEGADGGWERDRVCERDKHKEIQGE